VVELIVSLLVEGNGINAITRMMRQNMRRYTRLTAGHSKKVGISDHVWSIEELVKLSN
jgi:hypothetical protein